MTTPPPRRSRDPNSVLRIAVIGGLSIAAPVLVALEKISDSVFGGMVAALIAAVALRSPPTDPPAQPAPPPPQPAPPPTPAPDTAA